MKRTDEEHGLIAAYYKEHRDELRAFLAKRLGNADVADDFVQDVFVRLLTSERMVTRVTLPCLVYTVARNLVCDYWRHRRSVEEYEHYLAYSPYINKVADGASVYSAVEITELLERGMARLSDNQRVIYRMNIYDGMQVKDISARLQMNYKSVENRLGMARKEIRHYMARMLA